MDRTITGRMLLAMDIDGTSVGSDHRLGQASVAALRRFRQAGHVVCFASGRNDFDMSNMCGDHREADYVIGNTGGKLTRTRDDAVLSLHLPEPDCVRALAETCLCHDDCVLYVVAAGYMGVSRMTPGVMDYVRSNGCQPVVYTAAEQLHLRRVEAMMVSGNVQWAIETIGSRSLALDYVFSEPNVVDITPKGINKWSALLELCRLEDISPENVVAVGNYLNDRDMIENAGIGVAVGNAEPEIKALADMVLQRDHNHDAMEELVDKLLAM